MVNLLIDTCSLLTMANSHGYNNYVKNLNNFINDGHVRLYVHQIGLEEWQKHSSGDFDRKIQKLQKRTKIPESVTTDHLRAQYESITKLLANAHILSTPGKISDQSLHRYKNRLPPFHNKKDSFDDWEIFGSFAQHCIAEGIEDMYFVSKNSNEFSNTPWKEGDDDKDIQIHEELAKLFPSLKVKYFVKFNTFIHRIESDIQKPAIPNSFFNNKIEWGLTSKKTILESLEYLFYNAFSQIDFIPVDILIKFYPFTCSSYQRVYYRSGIVRGVSQELINFFKNLSVNVDYSINVIDYALIGEVQDANQLITKIVHRLWENTIHGFGVSGISEDIYITPPNGIIPDTRSHIFKFNYIDCLKILSSGQNFNKELERPYSNFKFGNFATAFRQYKELAEAFANSGMWFKYFVCMFNQRQVANYLKFPLVDIKDEINDKEIDASKNIDLYEVAYNHRHSFEYLVMLFVSSNEFFTEPYEIIAESAYKLNTKFATSSIPLMSQSSETSELVSEFRKIEAFLESNFIIYNDYSNFIKLFEYVIDGLFIANGLHDNYYGQIRELDDEWAEKVIKYGRKKVLLQSWVRYKRKPLTYRRFDFTGDDFFSISKRILLLDSGDGSEFSKFTNRESNFFSNSYQHTVENVLFLFTIIDLPVDQVSEFNKTLMASLRANKMLAQYWIFDAVNDYLQVKVPVMRNAEVSTIFSFFAKRGYFYSEMILATIAERHKGKKRFSISKRALKSLISDPRDGHRMSSFRRKLLAVSLLEHIDKDRSDYLRELIYSKLNQDDWFDNELFSIVLAMDIIEASTDDVLYAMRSVLTKLDVVVQKDFSMNTRAKIVDDLINVCFKLSVSLPMDITSIIKSMDPYYEWLLDMEAFDYSKFKFEWLKYYETRYYKSQKSLSINLRRYLEESLRTSIDRDVAEMYVYLFVVS